MFRYIKTIATLAAAAAWPAARPQEGPAPKDLPRVTWEESGDFRVLVKDLEDKFAGRIPLGVRIPRRDVKISIRDAGFFEALDALCRAHKEATYFTPRGEGLGTERLTVVPGPWVEYPASYHGHFKTAFVSMMRTARTSPEGGGARVDAAIVLFSPPWIPVSWASGTEVEWTVGEARDADGRDVLAPPERGPGADRIGIYVDAVRGGNAESFGVGLRDFDLDRGLKILAGAAKLRAVESRAVRVDAEAGATAEIPQGTLTVDSVRELDKSDDTTTWIVTVTLKPNDASRGLKLDRVIAPRARHDGDAGMGSLIDLPWQGWTFNVRTWRAERAPAWIELNVRIAERVIEIPFRFTDVAFGGK